jgi:hypothetical protein
LTKGDALRLAILPLLRIWQLLRSWAAAISIEMLSKQWLPVVVLLC